MIECIQEDKYIMFVDHIYDTEYLNIYFILLRDMITKFTDMKCTTFIQIVHINDYNECLASDDHWTLIDTLPACLEQYLVNDDNIRYIQCNLDDAMNCICRGLGLKI